MLTLRDIYLHEALERLDRRRHIRTRAPGDEGPRRSAVRSASRLAGRALIGLGVRLLAFGGAGAARPYIVPSPPPPTYSRN